MKRKILCILLVCCLLLFAGCREPVPPQVNTAATEPSITAVEPTAGMTETTTVITELEENQAAEAATTTTEPQATEPSKPEPTIPKLTEPIPSETVPPDLATEETVQPTTEPEQTQPAETDPSEPEATEPIPSKPYPAEPEIEQIDTAVLEAYGRSYASGNYGYNGTSDCNPNTGAGYFPGATKQILTMEDGYRLVKQAIDSQYRRDMAYGYSPFEEINGVTVQCPINIRIEPTGQPHVYIIWVYYGGDA